jgi:hypothetical protein
MSFASRNVHDSFTIAIISDNSYRLIQSTAIVPLCWLSLSFALRAKERCS